MSNNNDKKRLSDDDLRKKVARLRRAKKIYLPLGLIVWSLQAFLYPLVKIFSGFFDKIYSISPVWVPLLIFISPTVFGLSILQLWWESGKRIRAVVADTLLPELLSEKFTHVTCDAKRGINKRVISSVKLVDLARFTGVNHFLGLHKGRKVEFADYDFSYSTQYGPTRTFFKGPWMILDFGKQIPGRLRIRNRNGSSVSSSNTKSNIESPNSEFNRRFQILADDLSSAIYILTPQFMDQILRASAAANGQLLLCFEGSRVHVAINTGRETFAVTGEEWEMISLDKLRDNFRQGIRHLTKIIDIICEGDGLVG